MNQFLFALLFFLPAGIANSAPPVANKIPVLKDWVTPIDFGYKINNRRIFGKNKTWRGLTVGIILAGLSGIVIYPFLDSGAGALEHYLIGASLGLGALLGDAIESFFKRQIGIKSGESWLGFDQLDYVIGAILFSLPVVKLELEAYIFVIVSYCLMHLVGSYLGYKTGFKKKAL